jgi:hypothetical protein
VINTSPHAHTFEATDSIGYVEPVLSSQEVHCLYDPSDLVMSSSSASSSASSASVIHAVEERSSSQSSSIPSGVHIDRENLT